MAVARLFNLRNQFFTNAGVPAANYRLFIYTAGTSSKATTWSDAAGATPNTNPIVLDANGRPSVEIWAFTTTSLKLAFAAAGSDDPPAALIWTEDNVLPIGSGGGGSSSSASTAWVSIEDYASVGDYTTDDSGALRNAINALGARGGRVIFPAPTTGYYFASAVSIPVGVSLEGEGRNRVKVKGPSGGNIFTLASSLAGAGTNEIKITGMTFEGNGASSKMFVSTSTQFTGGVFAVEDCTIKNFGDFALDFGQSNYFNYVKRCYFVGNNGSVRAKKYADIWIEESIIGTGAGSNPQLDIYGGADAFISKNLFTYGGSGGGSDIRLNSAGGGGDAGHVNITENRFGNEGEDSTRYKVEINCVGSNSSLIPDVRISLNMFQGLDGQTCFHIPNATRSLHVTNNNFYAFAKLCNDAGVPAGETIGGGIWADNTVEKLSSITYGATQLFTNGGRHFGIIRSSGWEPDLPFDGLINQGEYPEIRNRLTYSEDFSNAAWTKTGVTLTSGQTDAFGGTTAFLVARNNAVGSENLHASINTTSMKNGKGAVTTGTDARLILSFWGKAGTLKVVLIGLYDTTDGFMHLNYVTLSEEWREHRVPFNGLNQTHGLQIYFYPGSTANMAGNIYLNRVGISDLGGDYVYTVGAVFSDTTVGRKLGRTLQAIGFQNAQSTQTSDYTLTYYDSTILVNGATKTMTLPTAVGHQGRRFTIKLIASGTTATVATTSSQTIDGASTKSLAAQYAFVTVESDNANWQIVATG